MAEPGRRLRAETRKGEIVRVAGGRKKSLFAEGMGVSPILREVSA
jgi:hypothetical protein